MPKTKTTLIFTTLLAFCVIVFGAYVRLTDAGLGCRDWPGCYGFITVPDTAEELSLVEESFPGQIVESGKAWREMTLFRHCSGHFVGTMHCNVDFAPLVF